MPNPSLRAVPRRRLAPIASVVCLLAACDSGASREVALLDSPELQAVVALQVARDGGALARLLDDGDPAVRARAAAVALGSVQYQGAATALTEALDDDDERVRAEAAFALGQLPLLSGVVEDALLERLAEERDPVARAPDHRGARQGGWRSRRRSRSPASRRAAPRVPRSRSRSAACSRVA